MGTRPLRNDLDRLLDRLDAGEDPGATGDLVPLLHPARAAKAALSKSLPSGVVQAHLAALRADRARNVMVIPPIRGRGLRMAAASVAAGIVLVMGAGSAVAASASSLPGDALYGVKKAVERISLAMHRDPVGRVALHLQFAATRLSEVKAVLATGGDPSEAVDGLTAALDDAEQEALHAIGKDSGALLAHVEEMISKHIATLTEVLGRVPDQAKDAIQRAIDNAEKAKANVQKGKNKDTGKPDDVGPPAAPPANGGTPPAGGPPGDPGSAGKND